MGNFIENVRLYLQERNIKNTYIELMTDWDKSKVSRVLRGDTELKYDDMVQIAHALGKDIVFFLGDKETMKVPQQEANSMAFFAGHLNPKDKKMADDLVEMFRFYDVLTTTRL